MGKQLNKCDLSVPQVQLLSILISLVLKVVPAGETAECNQSSPKPIRSRIGAGGGRSFTQGDNILKRVEAWRRGGDDEAPLLFPSPLGRAPMRTTAHDEGSTEGVVGGRREDEATGNACCCIDTVH